MKKNKKTFDLMKISIINGKINYNLLDNTIPCFALIGLLLDIIYDVTKRGYKMEEERFKNE